MEVLPEDMKTNITSLPLRAWEKEIKQILLL